MPRSLYAKLALALAGIFTLLGLFFVLLMGQASENHQREVTQKLNRDLAGHIVAERLLFRGEKIDQQALEQIFHMMMVINPKIELYLLDPAGKILAFSAPASKVKRAAVGLEPIRRFLNGASPLPLLGDDPRGQDRRKVFSVAPVTEQGRLKGYLYVILGGEQYDSIAQLLDGSYALKLSVAVLAAGLVFTLLSGLLLFAFLTRRLRRLAVQMDGFRRSDFRGNPPGAAARRGADEIDRLSDTFHAMAERIAAQVRRLEHTDAQRRELVANVSHDLRTPLASLQGYLETLSLKAQELDDAERRRYLDIACKHSKRLGRLVEELFDLAKLDANEIKPEVEPFSLPELVQDVLQKFELRAREARVRLESSFDEDMPFVLGDIALIERVLDNLLENALRHTPAGGTVRLSLRRLDRAVAVEVADTGCGIGEQDLAHVFDRFYKPAGTRSESGGAGLGLAIARRILELHGSVIRASSARGSGTEFAFDLPARPVANRPA
jgi:signal transduction histidine kinase